jgi:hypothetical protein
MSKRYQAAILTASYNGLKVPNAPTIGTATASGLSASVTFTAPSNIGGGAITGYTVVSSPGGITGTGSSSPVTVSGLTSGTSYTFTVVANNAYGSGPASAASNSITAVDPNAFIENLFSTWLYSGTGSAQTITNNINLSANAGLVWIKERTSTSGNIWTDTVRGVYNYLQSDNNNSQTDNVNTLTAFNTNGFAVGNSGATSESGQTYASWTFREQAKFFDIVTWTGDGTVPRTINHNLGSTPGCIIVKRVSGGFGEDWWVYHRSLTAGQNLVLNSTAASASGSIGSPTSTTFNISDAGAGNSSGYPYIAYLFAHDAGGFGASGSDNVISCGSFTTPSSGNATITLGYEPQWLMVKSSSNSSDWYMVDTMRGLSQTSQARLDANLSSAEEVSTPGWFIPTATGFTAASGSIGGSRTFIYIAIRRGPMAVPTVGTSVFLPITYSGNNSSTRQLTSGFPIDLIIGGDRSAPPSNVFDRLRGVSSASPVSSTASTADEQASVYGVLGMTYLQTGDGTVRYQNSAGTDYVDYFFRRAPSFFDEICYTGTGVSGLVLSHNLTVTPEFTLIKERTNDGIANWAANYNFTSTTYVRDILNRNDSVPAVDTYGSGGNNYAAAPTATTITVGAGGLTNANGSTYVAYLFATCAGVSKVGNYTGTGALQTINCGFAAGARFVLIKRTDSTGDWWVYDSARGITSGNDPYLFWNSTSAEVTGTNYVDTDTTGFKVTAAAPAGINASGGTYIFLAIA